MGFFDSRLKCKSCGYSWITRTGGSAPARCPGCGAQIYGTRNYRDITELRLGAFAIILLLAVPIYLCVPFFGWLITALKHNWIVAAIIIPLVFFGAVIAYRKIVLMHIRSQEARHIRNFSIKYLPIITLFILAFLTLMLATLIPDNTTQAATIIFAQLLAALGMLGILGVILYKVGKKIYLFLKHDVRRRH